MGLTNFILIVAGGNSVVLLLRCDVKQSAAIFPRNVEHIRNWLEEESAAASREAEKVTRKSRKRCLRRTYLGSRIPSSKVGGD